MRLYLTAETNIPDVYIDYIEVRLKNGLQVSLNWDESDISRDDAGFTARYKGVYFGEEYANGRLNELQGMEITDIGLYSESDGKFHFRITEMEFEDMEESLTFENPAMPESLREQLGEEAPQPFSDRLQSAISRAQSAPEYQGKEPERGH